jgi:ABC-type transport system involved in multi-copper enzyme maturation permease subunit
MWEFFRFELRYRLRQPAVYLFAAMFAVMTFAAATTDAVVIGGAAGQTAIDSPFVITQFLSIMSVLAVLLVVAFTAGAVVRDFDMGTYPLFFTRPIRRADYLLGRFFGGTAACMIVMLGAALGLAVGGMMPWLDSERLVGFSPLPYVHVLSLVVLPNLMVMGALFFALASLTRRLLFAYVGVIAFFVIYGVSQSFIADIDNETIAALADPFGMSAIELATRYWTPAERNTMLVPLSGSFALNRIVWLALSAAVLGWTVRRFQMRAPHSGAKKGVAGSESAPALDVAIPSARRTFDARAQLGMWRHLTRIELRQVVRSTPFIVIAAFAFANVFASAFGTTDVMYGTSVYPVTQLMLRLLDGALGLFLLIVLTFYAGEMIWRDRKVGLAEVNDALPIPNWVPLAAKLCALWAALVLLMLVGSTATMLFQLIKGYSVLELDLYATSLLGFDLPSWMVVSSLAVFFQVAANHKFAGYGLMVVYFVLRAALPAMGLSHPLYRYGALPSSPYSDMNGYGHYTGPAFWFRLYWGLAALGLVLIANLFWLRGTDNRLRLRLRQARRRITRLNTALLAACTLAFFAVGAFVFYNTNVLNTYTSRDDDEDQAQRYEQEYGSYADLPQPRLTAADLEADLYPAERRLEIRGTLTLRNKNDQPVDQLLVRIDPEMRINAFGLAPDTLQHHDEELGIWIYRLDPPLAPGAEMPVTFDLTFVEPGFKAGGSDSSIVHNGSFFHNSRYVPHFGYEPSGELSDPNERRKRGLPERARMADLEDETARKDTYITTEADWIDFRATVSTSADQIALAPGYLVDEWERDGRRFFRYEMDSPILNLYAFLSADYEVARDKWNDVDIAVYYHAPHAYNVQRMIDAVKKSLSYYTENFSPYQHRQLRIVEFPRYASFAQSLPNIVPYSESIGFIADLRDPDDIDYVFYVTAHEVAHQWWAHQVIGANVQGGTVMSETLAQYSALMVMEKEYGREKMSKFLDYELDRYLIGRATETHRELPLMRVENQPYIHYNKGSLVMYQLREYLGEDVVNGALARYIQKVGFQEPPYTTSTEFVEELRAVTPDEYAYLIEDLFETITIYDNRTTDVKVTPRADGRFDVTLTLETRKYRADERGHETKVELDDYIPLGVLGEDADGEEIPLYTELHRLSGDTSEITITVDQAPTRAGIDPNVLLIDRNPGDNVKRVN